MPNLTPLLAKVPTTAHPGVTIERHGKAEQRTARTATPDERAALWPRVVQTYSGHAGYQKRTERDIPLVILEPGASACPGTLLAL